MPKIEFGTQEEFKKWIKSISKSRRYSIYVVAQNSMVVAIPLVSTSPVNYGIFQANNLKEADEIANELSSLLNINMFKVLTLEFADFKTK